MKMPAGVNGNGMYYRTPAPVHEPYTRAHNWEAEFASDGTPTGFRCSTCKLSYHPWEKPAKWDTKHCSGVPSEAREVEA